jgi:biotin carboxylase
MGHRILLIESGKESYRAFTFEALRKDGVEIALAAKARPTWQERYIYDFVEADVDAPTFQETVLAYCRKNPVDGVLTFVERLVPMTAEISVKLGLRSLLPEAAYAARNKEEMRRRFAAAGLKVPKVISFKQAKSQEHGGFILPAVVKPVMGFASLNVIKIESWSQLAWVEEIMGKDNHPTLPHPGDAYLVEEYIDGPEYSIESGILGEDIVHYSITKKVTSQEPYFEEVAHITPAPLSSSQAEEMYSVATRAMRALGLNHCVTHTEIRFSKNRGPVVIEVAARLGGDKIPFLVETSTGASPSVAAGRALLGRPLPPARPAERASGVVFFVPREQGATRGTVAAPPAVEGLREFEYWTKEGTEVKIPPEQFFTRLGYALVEGPSPAEVAARLESVVNHVQKEIGIRLESDIVASISRGVP